MALKLKYLCIFLIFPISKAVINFYRLRRLKKLLEEYKKYVFKELEFYEFLERKGEIIELFKNAGLSDKMLPVHLVETTHILSGNISVFDNISYLSKEFIGGVRGFFHEAVGIYTKRLEESYSPIYWFETLVFLPKLIIRCMGLEDNKAMRIIAKVVDVIYWIATVGIFVSQYDCFAEIRRILKLMLQTMNDFFIDQLLNIM